MRVLMLDNEFPPLGGGTGVVNYHLLKEFATYPDLWIDLITSSRTRRSFESEQFAERITIYKVPVDNRNLHHSTNVELLRYAWRGWRLSRQLLAQQHYELSFAFAGVPAGAMSWAVWLSHRLRYVVSLQGPDVPGFEARYNYLYPFLRPLLRLVWRQAAVVTAISAEHQRLAHETLPGLTIPIVPNGVDTEVFYPNTRAPDKVQTIMCVGRLIERKGQHHLLRAFARLVAQQPKRNLILMLVGTGDAEPNLKALVCELNVADRVQFCGVQLRSAMPDLYRQADIFVLPSQSEGMSMALLEAMATGLPVIVTDAGGTAELVREGDNGLIVQWADVAGLADALARLIDEPNVCRAMGEASRQRAQAFAWPTIASTYRAMFESITA